MSISPGSAAFADVSNAMIQIGGGPFWMGSDEGSHAERPRHEVFLDDYCIDEALVTNRDFSRFVAATGYRTSVEQRCNNGRTWRTFSTPERSNHPVVCVSWHDAVAYAAWVGKKLPSEAEWEKAAKGGCECAVYPWGDQPPREDLTNWMPTSQPGALLPTRPVKQYAPNPFGLFDMTGAVWQWCADWFDEDYYSLGVSANPLGPPRGEYRARRGGAFNVREAFRLRCANRGAMVPDQSWPNLGFRCAVSGMGSP